MAIYRCEFKIYGRSKGRSAVAGAAYVTGSKQVRKANSGTGGRVSAVAAAAYRSGGSLADKQAGEVFDYTQKHNVAWSGILAPEDAPAWATDRGQLWNAVEAAENRKDAQLFRECLLTLPRGLDRTEQIALVRAFVQDQFVSQGMVADIGLHCPDASDGEANPHAHVMLTLRRLDASKPSGFGLKETAWNEVQWQGKGANTARQGGFLHQRRAAWADYCNAALADAGSAEKVDHRSLKARGIDRAPQPKLGKAHYAKPAPWVGIVHDNHAGARFENRTRAMMRAVSHGKRVDRGAAMPTVLPIGGDPDPATRQMIAAVHLAKLQSGYRLARDGVAHAEEVARWLRGAALKEPEPSRSTDHER